MANLEVKDDFIDYCNGKNCNAQEELNEILNKVMNKEETPPLETPKEEIIKKEETADLNKLIQMGMS
tara:strand:+ start:2734 stop:2934 length:201 start_codon:yes stop_codon:yes gene_type:complete